MIVYLTSTLILVILAAIAGLALNLQWGLGGLINFGLFGFYMLGAYVCGLLTVAGLSPWWAMIAAMLASAVVCALVSLISIRLSEDYLAIVTLGFAECLRIVIRNESGLTRGPQGLPGIARPFMQGLGPLNGDAAFLALCLACLVVVLLVFQAIARSAFGRTLRCIREDPLVASALGRNVMAFRVKAFAIGGGMIGLAGSLHAFYYTYIDPTQFTTIITAYAFLVVMMGGRGSAPGLLLSAFPVVFLLEGSRFLSATGAWLDASKLAGIRLIVVGSALIAILRFRSTGFFTEYRLRVADRGDTPESNARW